MRAHAEAVHSTHDVMISYPVAFDRILEAAHTRASTAYSIRSHQGQVSMPTTGIVAYQPVCQRSEMNRW